MRGKIEVFLKFRGILGEDAECVEGTVEPEFVRLGYGKPKAFESGGMAQQDSSKRIDGLVDFGLVGIIDMLETRL